MSRDTNGKFYPAFGLEQLTQKLKVMKEIKNKAKEIVANVIADMYYNNAKDCNHESFRGWCEDGEVFDYMEIPDNIRVECNSLMEEIAPLVDQVTNLLIWEHE